MSGRSAQFVEGNPCEGGREGGWRGGEGRGEGGRRMKYILKSAVQAYWAATPPTKPPGSRNNPGYGMQKYSECF